MNLINRLTKLSPIFKSLAELTDDQKKKVNTWETPHHSFSDKAMGGANKSRVVIPLKTQHILPPKIVTQALQKHGYHEFHYGKGIVKDHHGRETKIGKTLAKHGETEALAKFVGDKRRSAKEEHEVVISRHPHDVAGMSTNQGWTSCMNMENGAYKDYLPEDIKHGTHVAYLVKKGDHEIKHPVARIALKPFKNEHTGDTVLHPEGRTYGTANSNFEKTVSAWTKKHFKTKQIYDKPYHLYNDNLPQHIGTGVIKSDYDEAHYKNGQLHRDGDLPAIVYNNGEQHWYKNGKRHRDGNKPAYIGYKLEKYFKNGKLHRDGDNPAVVYKDGRKEWFKNGKRHRDGAKPSVTDGTIREYHKNGKLHRDGDKPARIKSNGTLVYYKKGEVHRDGDKPAYINKRLKQKEWFKNGRRHRDGNKPASIEPHRDEYWKRGKFIRAVNK